MTMFCMGVGVFCHDMTVVSGKDSDAAYAVLIASKMCFGVPGMCPKHVREVILPLQILVISGTDRK
jgi:hypothetical protein